jgi:hypothetical protein
MQCAVLQGGFLEKISLFQGSAGRPFAPALRLSLNQEQFLRACRR